jgi:hypothetical protein
MSTLQGQGWDVLQGNTPKTGISLAEAGNNGYTPQFDFSLLGPIFGGAGGSNTEGKVKNHA